MSLWENMTGTTADGKRTDKMPDRIKLVYSIKNHIQQLINIRKGASVVNGEMGIVPIPGIFKKRPSWIADFSESLKEMLLRYDPRIQNLFLYRWQIDKTRLCLLCTMIVVTQQNQVLRFRAFFPGIGENYLNLAAVSEEE